MPTHRRAALRLFSLLILGLALTSWAASAAFADKESAESWPANAGPEATSPLPLAPDMGVTPAPGENALAKFGPASGTTVSVRASELRSEVARLRSSVGLSQNEFAMLRSNGAAGAVQYHSTVAAITARLQNGTTRGNPILLRQWEEAEASLNEVTTSLDRLNGLSNVVSADASLASYLLEAIQGAFQLSGAVDEDHDQLRLLRDDVTQTLVALDNLRNQVAGDISRQTSYLTAERSNLQTLAFAINRGEMLGNSLANRPVIVNPPSQVTFQPAPTLGTAPVTTSEAAPAATVGTVSGAAPAAVSGTAPVATLGTVPATTLGTVPVATSGAAPAVPVSAAPLAPTPPSGDRESSGPDGAYQTGAMPSLGHLLVLIRYNQPVVHYEEDLSSAVSLALQNRPEASFTVVAITPQKGDSSEIARAREAAGRNAESVKRALIQLGLPPSKISLGSAYLAAAQTPEVHVYVQ